MHSSGQVFLPLEQPDLILWLRRFASDADVVQWTAIAVAAIAAHPDLSDQLGRHRCCEAVTAVTCPIPALLRHLT